MDKEQNGEQVDRRKSHTNAQHHAANAAQQEELVATSSSQRNWRGIGIALLVILVVCALIITAVVLLTPGNEGPRVKGERITLDDILGDNFTADRFNGTWLSDYELAFRNQEGALLIYNVRTRNATVFVTSNPFREASAVDYSISADRKYILFTCEVFKVFRYSFLAKYIVYNVATGDIIRLLTTDGKFLPMQYAEWSPKGSALVMVYENDIYYKRTPEDETSLRITNTGQSGTVWNGVPDWVYEEEILSSNKALWFSGDGQMLAFATFNDSKVETMSFMWYGKTDDRYSRIVSVRYPKTGSSNPTVVLWVANMTGRRPALRDLKPPLGVKDQLVPNWDHYFTAVRWVNNTCVSVIWMNRAQNISIITMCTAPFWYCSESQQVDMEGQGWVDLFTPPLFSADGSKYFVILPVQDGQFGFFPQVNRKIIGDKHIDVLTHGKWEVTSIKSYNEKYKQIYYIAAPEDMPGQRQLYRVTENKTNVHKTGECLTCHLGPDCLYVDATFSPNTSYYVLECLGPAVPRTFLIDIRKNETITELDSHSDVRDFVASKAMPKVKTFRVETVPDKFAYVSLFFPPGLREEEITRYPLIIEVYGGPGSQMVSERYKVGYGHYLSSQKDMIYGFIDGRGSGFQGSKVLFEIYRKFGTVEVEDQLTVTEYLRDTLHYVDRNKLAIWGWSYGGYVTAMAMGVDAKVFNCGISVAPVTNWLYYDSVYTERYMGYPTHQDNLNGYEKGDVLKRAPHFQNKKYFLIHGTADDNVHFQQSMMLTKELTRADIIFRTQVYPDENHSLSSMKRHLYQSMEDFLHDCFREEKKEEIGLQKNSGSE